MRLAVPAACQPLMKPALSGRSALSPEAERARAIGRAQTGRPQSPAEVSESVKRYAAHYATAAAVTVAATGYSVDPVMGELLSAASDEIVIARGARSGAFPAHRLSTHRTDDLHMTAPQAAIGAHHRRLASADFPGGTR